MNLHRLFRLLRRCPTSSRRRSESVTMSGTVLLRNELLRVNPDGTRTLFRGTVPPTDSSKSTPSTPTDGLPSGASG